MDGNMNKKLLIIYEALLKHYGPQGWWPLTSLVEEGKDGGYHPGDYEHPKTELDAYEIIVGAILTQNTSWSAVERAIQNLRQMGALDPHALLSLSDSKLKRAIKPAGYYNQKALYLKEATKFFMSLNKKTPTRKDLLSVKGVGNETADSILLYAYKQPQFVIDAYTKRIAFALNLADESVGYMELKDLFESNLPKDVALYQEFHALLVEHAKHFYSKKTRSSLQTEVDFLKEFL